MTLRRHDGCAIQQVITPDHLEKHFLSSLRKTLTWMVCASLHHHGRPLIPPLEVIANRAVI